MRLHSLIRNVVGAALLAVVIFAVPAFAAPPVRIAIVPGSGSGMEQEVCDQISGVLETQPNIKLGKLNADWIVTCTISDKSDLTAQTTRVNGTVTIKTIEGHVIDTISSQSNKQDFNLNPGVPAPMNKALVDSAVREVIGAMSQRAIGPIQEAVEIEMATREKIIKAQYLGDDDKYDEALEILMTISPDTPHFKGARALIAEFQMEQEALDLIKEAQSNVKQGKTRQAIALLKAVNSKSKRAKLARSMLASLSAGTRRVAKRTAPTSGSGNAAQLKALAAQKKALEVQRKAIEAQEAALKTGKP